MSDEALNVLKANLQDLSLSLKWLNRSYNRCSGIGIKEEYTDDEYDQFENLTSRYARTVDLLINKMFRSIDIVELYDGGSLIDTANRAEKRGLVDSVSLLRNLKTLRNEIAHEYEADDLQRLFGAVLNALPQVFDVANRLTAYCAKYENA
jgi:hypothetical protein